ncbi:MAG: HD domain-containing protein [Oligoflexales bacterium]|nr:HD domain-containing protein [Oligoflexales bacterium]
MDCISDRFHDALVFACRLHAGQLRKTSSAPYISHLLGVASTVLKCHGNEDQAVAALLHDALEDQGHKITADEIGEKFGQVVKKLVLSCTDERSENRKEVSWRARKEKYLSHIEALPSEAMLLIVADKLDNARDIRRNLIQIGEVVWDRFQGKKEGMLWYQSGLITGMENWLKTPRAYENPWIPMLIDEFKCVCSSFIPKKE